MPVLRIPQKLTVWYAESEDGIHWQNIFNKPVLDNGEPGSWDENTVQCGAIIKINNLYYMYYNGWQSPYGPWQIGLATSTDGINWEKHRAPILKADSNYYENGAVSVIKYNGQYYMYCSSSPYGDPSKIRINLAISSDGLNWNMYANNPVLQPSLPWEGNNVSYSSVIFDNNRFIMIYSNEDRTEFGIAFSQNGINWNKSAQPTFSSGQTYKHWDRINYPFLMKVGNEYKLYYTANYINYTTNICVASRSVLN